MLGYGTLRPIASSARAEKGRPRPVLRRARGEVLGGGDEYLAPPGRWPVGLLAHFHGTKWSAQRQGAALLVVPAALLAAQARPLAGAAGGAGFFNKHCPCAGGFVL